MSSNLFKIEDHTACCCLTDQIGLASPKPVHFRLETLAKEAEEKIRELHTSLLGAERLRVYPLKYFEGESCAVHEGDLHKTMKIRARGFLLHENLAVSFMPERFWGFSAELLNGNMFYIGLSIFPRLIELSNSVVISTKLQGLAVWQSFNQTVNPAGITAVDCVQSHIMAIAILRTADKIGMRVHVNDPIGCWQYSHAGISQ